MIDLVQFIYDLLGDSYRMIDFETAIRLAWPLQYESWSSACVKLMKSDDFVEIDTTNGIMYFTNRQTINRLTLNLLKDIVPLIDNIPGFWRSNEIVGQFLGIKQRCVDIMKYYREE